MPTLGTPLSWRGTAAAPHSWRGNVPSTALSWRGTGGLALAWRGTAAQAQSWRGTIVAPQSWRGTVSPPMPLSWRGTATKPLSWRGTVSPPMPLSWRGTAYTASVSPFYEVTCVRHADQNSTVVITIALHTGFVLPAPVTISLALARYGISGGTSGSFSAASVTLSNTARSTTLTLTTSEIGPLYLVPSHTGYAPLATPAPTPLYSDAVFAAGSVTDTSLDFAGTGPSGLSSALSFAFDIDIALGLTGQRNISSIQNLAGFEVYADVYGTGQVLLASNLFGVQITLSEQHVNVSLLSPSSGTFRVAQPAAGQHSYFGNSLVLYDAYHNVEYIPDPYNAANSLAVPQFCKRLTGHFECTVEFDEYIAVGADTNDVYAGPYAEPFASKNYATLSPYGYTCSWSSTWSSDFDGATDPFYTAPFQQTSGSFKFGECYVVLSADGTALTPFNNGTPPYSVVSLYPPAPGGFGVHVNYASYAAQSPSDATSVYHPECYATVGLAVNLGLGGTVSASSINFGDAGLWTPRPYTGRNAGENANIVVAPGSFLATGTDLTSSLVLSIRAAALSTFTLNMNVYDGEQLATRDYYFVFGNVQVGTGNPTIVGNVGSTNLTYLTCHNGRLSVQIPQIYSDYGVDPSWFPALPAKRNDYRPNALQEINALPVPPATTTSNYAYDSPCYFLDDVVFPITTLSHAALTVLESFESVANWTVTNGTKGSDGALVVTASASTCAATTATGYNKDCRHYRYLRFTVNATAAQGSLTFVLTDKLGVHKTWISPALTAGVNLIEFDLCHPQTPGSNGTTRTVWDVSPGALYGVQNIDQLQMTGFAVGNAVTISNISLFRKNPKVQGRVQNEMMPTGNHMSSFAGTIETEWYPPDVPVTGGASVDPTVLDGWEDTITGLTNTSVNHKLYGRQIAARVDGKFAIDVPHAVQTYPFVDPVSMGLWEQVLNRDRLSINGAIALMSGIPGLTFSPTAARGPTKIDPRTGLPIPVYSGRMPAVYLTVSDGINAASLDTDLNGMQILAQPLYNTIRGYAGQIQHSARNVLKRHKGSVEGLIINVSGGSAQGISVSLTPYNPAHPPASVGRTSADADGYYRFSFAGLGPYIASTNLASAQGLLHQRAWRWLSLTGSTPVAGGGCLEIDSVRGWLYVGLHNQIGAYHLSDYQQVFVSTPYSVDSWRALRCDVRCATLVMLGISGSGSSKTFSVWRSQDGGLTGTEVASVTANSSAIERDSPNGLFAWFYETGDPHTIMVRYSNDGGRTYGSAVTCQYNSADLQAVILDVKQDDRNGSLMIMLCQQGGNTLILQSKTKGLDWTLQLSA